MSPMVATGGDRQARAYDRTFRSRSTPRSPFRRDRPGAGHRRSRPPARRRRSPAAAAGRAGPRDLAGGRPPPDRLPAGRPGLRRTDRLAGGGHRAVRHRRGTAAARGGADGLPSVREAGARPRTVSAGCAGGRAQPAAHGGERFLHLAVAAPEGPGRVAARAVRVHPAAVVDPDLSADDRHAPAALARSALDRARTDQRGPDDGARPAVALRRTGAADRRAEDGPRDGLRHRRRRPAPDRT